MGLISLLLSSYKGFKPTLLGLLLLSEYSHSQTRAQLFSVQNWKQGSMCQILLGIYFSLYIARNCSGVNKPHDIPVAVLTQWLACPFLVSPHHFHSPNKILQIAKFIFAETCSLKIVNRNRQGKEYFCFKAVKSVISLKVNYFIDTIIEFI